jgi:hypothetical protein
MRERRRERGRRADDSREEWSIERGGGRPPRFVSKMSGTDDQESRDTMLEEVMPQNHMMYCWLERQGV